MLDYSLKRYDPLWSEHYPESLTHGPSGSWFDTAILLYFPWPMLFTHSQFVLLCSLPGAGYCTRPVLDYRFNAICLRFRLFWTHSWLRARKNGRGGRRSDWRRVCDILGGNLLFSRVRFRIIGDPKGDRQLAMGRSRTRHGHRSERYPPWCTHPLDSGQTNLRARYYMA